MELEHSTQLSKFFIYLYFMRLKLLTLFKILLLLSFTNKQYQFVSKYKDQIALRQRQKFLTIIISLINC